MWKKHFSLAGTCFFLFFFLDYQNFLVGMSWYCWWKKSCTSWWVVYPIIYKVLYIKGGFSRISEPSTVVFFKGYQKNVQIDWNSAVNGELSRKIKGWNVIETGVWNIDGQVFCPQSLETQPTETCVDIWLRIFIWMNDGGVRIPFKRRWLMIHPGRLTWNLLINHLERKMIFQTFTIMFHVNLPGCISIWFNVNKNGVWFFHYPC